MRIKLAVHVYMDVTTNQLWLVNDEDSSEMRVYRLMSDQREEGEEPFTASEVEEVDENLDVVAYVNKVVHDNEYGVTPYIYSSHKDTIELILEVLRDDPTRRLTPYEINNKLGTPIDKPRERDNISRLLRYLAGASYIKQYHERNRHYTYQVKGPNGHHHKHE